MAQVLNFISRQWTEVPYPTESFNGQTLIVTGSNTGLGLETARHFARLGASKVILAVRSIAKGEEAAESIHKSTGRKGVCEVWQVDMGNFDSIKEFAQKVSRLDRLDAVVENAGVQTWNYTATEGMETTIAVNVVGTFLLALGLLPTLRKSGKKHGIVPRLVIVSSDVHFWASFAERKEESIFDALNKDDPKYIADRYNTSKLLEIFTIRELAEKLNTGPHSKEKIILNTVSPGFCHSSLSRETTGPMGVIVHIMKLILARTTEAGSRNFIAAASAGEESHGQYMSECAVQEASEFVRSKEGEETQKRVFEELVAVLEKIQPGIAGNI